MRKIWVLYDSRCGVCSRLREWVGAQPTFFDVEFVPAGSARAQRLFPELRHDEKPSELAVVSDEGDVYFDEAAWLVCLYALVEYRAWSFRLAHAPLQRLARTAWLALSKNRVGISSLLALKSDAELARELDSQPVSCEAGEWTNG